MKLSKSYRNIIILVAVLVIITIIIWIFFKYQLNSNNLLNEPEYENYQYHFVMILDEKNPFWESVFESAKQSAQEKNAYLELLGDNINIEYSQSDYLKIAIAQQVDGILLEPANNENISKEVNLAVQKGIPVITMMEDIPISQRQCFVGVSNYNLGQEYGEQLLQLIGTETMEVMVLVSKEEENSKKLVFSGIKEIIEQKEFDIQAKMIENEGPFATEEAIRNIIMSIETMPDVLVCLNSVETECAYQAVVDYNKVGEIDIVGFFDSQIILDAIDKNIIYSTIAVDTEELGTKSIDAIFKYMKEGRVTDFVTVDTTIINKSNVQQIMKRDAIP